MLYIMFYILKEIFEILTFNILFIFLPATSALGFLEYFLNSHNFHIYSN